MSNCKFEVGQQFTDGEDTYIIIEGPLYFEFLGNRYTVQNTLTKENIYLVEEDWIGTLNLI